MYKFFFVLLCVILLTFVCTVNRHEDSVSKCVIDPTDSDTRVVGCQDALRELEFAASFLDKPVKNKLFAPTSGVLLYGPPGTGKTMLAKSVSKMCKCTFVSVSPDRIESKFVGESNKYLSACFTLAEKSKPSVIFIDELDGLFSTRSATDPSHSSVLKTFFLQLADNMKPGVLLVAATNRLDAVDSAVLRRFPSKFYLGVPDDEQRLEMFKNVLQDQTVDHDVDYTSLARSAAGMSYAEIYEHVKACGRRKCMNATQDQPWTMSDLDIPLKE